MTSNDLPSELNVNLLKGFCQEMIEKHWDERNLYNSLVRS